LYFMYFFPSTLRSTNQNLSADVGSRIADPSFMPTRPTLYSFDVNENLGLRSTKFQIDLKYNLKLRGSVRLT